MDVGDPTVGDPRLRAVQHPLVLGLVVDRLGPQRGDIGAGVGLAHAVGTEAELAVVEGEALRHPLHRLLGRALPGDAGGGEAGAEDRQTDASVPPEELFEGEGQGEAGRVAEHRVGEEVERVQPDPGRLLDDRVRELLPLVPLLGGRAHHGLGEVVDPLLDRQLVLVQAQGEVSHRCTSHARRGASHDDAEKLPDGNSACRERASGPPSCEEDDRRCYR